MPKISEKYSKAGLKIFNKLNEIYLDYDPFIKNSEYVKQCQKEFADVDKDENIELIKDDLFRRWVYRQIDTRESGGGSPDKPVIIDLLKNGEFIITAYGRAFSDLMAQTDFIIGYLMTDVEEKIEKADRASTLRTNSLTEEIIKNKEESTTIMDELRDINKDIVRIEKTIKENEETVSDFNNEFQGFKDDMENLKINMEQTKDTIQTKIYTQVITIMGIFVAIIALIFQGIGITQLPEPPIFHWTLFDRFLIVLIHYSPLIIVVIILAILFKIQFHGKDYLKHKSSTK